MNELTEDLIIMKAFAGRALDWNDVRGILVRQAIGNLNWPLIWTELKPLAEVKEEPAMLSMLRSLKDEISATASLSPLSEESNPH